MPVERYLKVRDIMAALGVSRSRGYEVARECDHLKFGQTLRVSEAAFARWVQEHERKGRQSTKPAPPPLDVRIAAKAAKYHQRREAVRA